MCTLTFLPDPRSGGYLLAHNRDESFKRGPGLPPVISRLGATRILAPRDSDAGGTWIGVDDRGRCLAILNGDGRAAAPTPGDARSRGLLVMDLLADARPAAVRATLERHVAAGTLRSKPFKLVAVEPAVRGGAGGSHAAGAGAGATDEPWEARLLRIDWDGARLDVTEGTGAQCIVSSTFESERVAAARRAAFAQCLGTLPRETGGPGAPRGPREADPADRIDDPTGLASAVTSSRAAALRAFHAGHAPSAPQGDAFSVCMHRPDARTVSRTLLLVGPREARMEYTAGWPCAGTQASVSSMELQTG